MRLLRLRWFSSNQHTVLTGLGRGVDLVMMKRLSLWLLCLWMLPFALLAERVADLPMPTRYVNDFAGVLSPQARQSMEDECNQLHNQANADVAVVTIKQLEDGESVVDFTVALEEKWKLGKKGSDRSAIYVLVLNPHRLRIEVGYGLEGILNDAKVGAILDQARPYAAAGNYDQAMETGLDGVAEVIAADAHVTLSPVPHGYQPAPARTAQRSNGAGLVVGLVLLALVLVLVMTGNGGLLFSILFSLLGSGGGGFGGGRDGDGFGGGGGGGFSGSGGGESGGGGASRDF